MTIPYLVAGILIYINGIRVYFEGDFIGMIIYTSIGWILFLMAYYSIKKKPKDADSLGEPFLKGGELS
ncbi:MAG: hypothetical protein AMQ74_01703 [Candidatus Methanofastidiosum methylothiophilum]|uniref:Uncharacterized protein n=1 Tax=Candidatus Methanofastidiosum methylothiophilum TaxID=1705564 RepID=A0A150IQI7_9EURY|nr:MAG: hypothetical protein AMQ74_01703 [Candidatus Methanofastidiosum methylthiophilus]NMC75889.1 hypothetical protein [Candidatus Methanofastidiosa archaeon]